MESFEEFKDSFSYGSRNDLTFKFLKRLPPDDAAELAPPRRAVEESGIPTVSVFVRSFRHVAMQMTLPRTLITRHPMGRPIGASGDEKRHREVIRGALRLFEDATEAGTIVELDAPFRAGSWSG